MTYSIELSFKPLLSVQIENRVVLIEIQVVKSERNNAYAPTPFLSNLGLVISGTIRTPVLTKN